MHYTTRSILSGALVITIAYILYAVMLTLGKVAKAEVGTSVVLLFQMGIAALILCPLLLQGGRAAFYTKHPFRHLFRGLSGLLSYVFFYVALGHIILTEATLMNNAAPLFVPFISLLMLNERISLKTWWGILFGFVGIALVLNPELGNFNPWILFALCSGLSMALAVSATKLLGFTERALAVVFYYASISTVVVIPFAWANWVMPSPGTWPILILVGLLFTVVQLLLVFGFRRGPVALLSPLCYLSVLFCGLFDWLFWDHVLGLVDLMGALLVIFGGTWTVLIGRKGWRVEG